MKLVTCPQCNGSKELSVSVTEIAPGKKNKNSVTKLPCPTCRGEGKVSPAAAKAHKQALEAWCTCGNPSGETQYYADGEHPQCSKHCWTCQDCGKILQVG